MQAKILPRSLVGVTKTRTPFPAIIRTPTVFSGLDCIIDTKNKIHSSALLNPKQLLLL
jgi:hypothetical protein